MSSLPSGCGVGHTTRCTTLRIVSMADYDGAAIVNKYCDAIADRVRFDADLSQTLLADLSCAIVFVNAFWSGPSMLSLTRLAHLLADVDPDGSIQLVVCDIDYIPDLSDAPWGLITTGGIGEMLWVSKGVILARHHPPVVCDVCMTTCNLVDECSA